MFTRTYAFNFFEKQKQITHRVCVYMWSGSRKADGTRNTGKNLQTVKLILHAKYNKYERKMFSILCERP